ncbi:hypothetical protein JZ751_021041 [Albula glossodonta]|uniref:sphingomyelin phosphodiesterase n=1 Tax=Albula glossodonta TaxID=121402 RepID=A0A8T2PNX4_9TELE|nr:hypothetical protein JZ751_021041 [Albula glossodonta]
MSVGPKRRPALGSGWNGPKISAHVHNKGPVRRILLVMEHEEARKEYLVYPVGKKQCSKKKGQKTPLRGNGRRIDYILYSEEVQPPGWKVAVEEYSFITQLATLTDHLPVSMRLAVSTGVEVS